MRSRGSLQYHAGFTPRPHIIDADLILFSNEFESTRFFPHHTKRKPTDRSVMKFLKNGRNSENTGKNLRAAFRSFGFSLRVAGFFPLVWVIVTSCWICGCVEIRCSKLVWLCLVVISVRYFLKSDETKLILRVSVCGKLTDSWIRILGECTIRLFSNRNSNTKRPPIR